MSHTRGITLLLVVLVSIFSTSIQQARAASQCTVQDSRVYCTGASITDSSLLMLKDELHLRFNHMYFLDLFITGTEVTRIGSGTFAEVEFENIYIEDNAHLTYVAEDAFANQKAKTLLIINNPLLKNNSVYSLADKLHVSEYVDMASNALLEVPSNAFNERLPAETFYANTVVQHVSHNNGHHKANTHGVVHNMVAQVEAKILHEIEVNERKIQSAPTAKPAAPPTVNKDKKAMFTKLVLSHNQIETISSDAFHLLKNCKEIYLNYNKLKYIAVQGFNLLDHVGSSLDSSTDKPHLMIQLSNNQLTKDSFEVGFIEMNNHTNVILNLSQNSITELRKDIFGSLLETKGLFIDITGNPLDCKSADGVLWIKEKPALLAKTRGINCQ